jgi:hypothetical protein
MDALTAEQLTEKVVALEQSNTALKTKVEGAEELLQRHKTELGDARKEIQSSIEKLQGAGQDADSLKKLVDRIGAIEQTVTLNKVVPTGLQGGTKGKERIAELVKGCTPEQRKVANAAFLKLTQEKQQYLLNDEPEFEKFVNAAKEAVPEVPASPFDIETTEEQPNVYRKMFGLAERESTHVPGVGQRRGPSGFAGATKTGQPSPQTSRRLPGGIIPRPTIPSTA